MLRTSKRRPSFGHLARQLDQTVEQMIHRHFSHFSATEKWTPAVNAYRLADRIEVCVDLAGVDGESIDIQALPHELVLRGVRQPPEPNHKAGEPIQILCMEIDHGPFERVVRLPARVDVDRVSATTECGLLWIRLPLLQKPGHRGSDR